MEFVIITALCLTVAYLAGENKVLKKRLKDSEKNDARDPKTGRYTGGVK